MFLIPSPYACARMLFLLSVCLFTELALVGGLRLRDGEDADVVIPEGQDEDVALLAAAEEIGTDPFEVAEDEVGTSSINDLATVLDRSTDTEIGSNEITDSEIGSSEITPTEYKDFYRTLVLKGGRTGSGVKHSCFAYLAQAYQACRRIPALASVMPIMNYSELQDRYAAPKFNYHPWITSLPVIYITTGGSRLEKFNVMFHNFSPNMIKIDAFIPTGQNTDEAALAKLVDHPRMVIDRIKASNAEGWKKVLGCLVSHLKAIKKAWDSQTSMALIVEDDAVPMYPAWRTSLEEFIVGLPSDWEAVQMQWTTRLATSFYGKHRRQGGATLPWSKGRGWGTAAYLLHRRGLERLMSELWSKFAHKFKVDNLMRSCPKMTADDCLLGFTGRAKQDPEYQQTLYFPQHTEPLVHVYVPRPNLFIHDSHNNLLHAKNYCQDLKQVMRLYQSYTPPEGTERVLVVFTVNATQKDMTKAQNTLSRLKAGHYNIFVAYHDVSPQPNPATRRLRTLWQHWQDFGKSWEQQYDYIWVIDENTPLDSLNLTKAIGVVYEANSSITSPAVVDSMAKRTEAVSFQEPDSNCRYRYTNFVGAVAPVFKTWALTKVFQRFGNDFNRTRADAIDHFWCRWIEQQETEMEISTPRPCAVLDDFVVNTTKTSNFVAREPVDMKWKDTYGKMKKFANWHKDYYTSDGTFPEVDGEPFAQKCVGKYTVRLE